MHFSQPGAAYQFCQLHAGICCLLISPKSPTISFLNSGCGLYQHCYALTFSSLGPPPTAPPGLTPRTLTHTPPTPTPTPPHSPLSMHHLAINFDFGFGFFFGIVLCTSALLIAIFLLARSVFAKVQNRDLSADRKTGVDAIASIVADVLSHPKVVDALSATIATGINRWITSPDSQEAIRQVYAKAPRSEAVREIGKEVPTYVKSFGLGVVDALTFRGGSDGADGSSSAEAKNPKKSKVHPKKE